MSFRIESIDNVEILHINHGQLNEESQIRELGSQLLYHIEQQPHKKVLLDIDSVEFISSAMVGQLISLQKSATRRGVEIRICNVAPIISEVLRMVRFEMIMPVHDNQADALAAFKKSNSAPKVRSTDSATLKTIQEKSDQGDAESQFRLGVCYEEGDGIARNSKQAIHWFEKASEQGHLEAMNSLAMSYAYGMNTDQDFARAMPWYEKAAAAGHPDSQYMIGLALHHGLDGDMDLETAKTWYEKSAAQGHKEAADKLKEIESEV